MAKVFQVVKCNICHKTFPVDSDDFVHVIGGIHKGMFGGILGSALDKDGIQRGFVYCPQCFLKEFLKYFFE